MKKKLKNCKFLVLVLIFMGSLLAIGEHIFMTTFSREEHKVITINDSSLKKYHETLRLDLGNVEVRKLQSMGQTKAFVKFSPDDTKLAIGTENGEIILLSTKLEKVIWRQKIGIGKITALEFSQDSKFLYIGEQSPSGNIFCLDALDGAEKWRFSTQSDIGVNIRLKNYPAVASITTDEHNNVYFVAMRYSKDKTGLSEYIARIYAFDRTGQKKWQYPNNENMDAWATWVSVDKQGSKLAFATANFERAKLYDFDKNIYVLDARQGMKIYDQVIEPVHPNKVTVMRASPNLSPDGKYLAAMASDGRAFFYDSEGVLLWDRKLSTAKEMNGIYLNSLGRDAYINNKYVLFATVNTYNNANWQLATPVEHPSSNSLFIFDLTGKFISKWQAGGSIERIDYNNSLIAMAVGRNTKTKDLKAHGIYVLDFPSLKLVETINTEGPSIAVSISNNGKYLAGIEAPIEIEGNKIIGSYRLVFLKTKDNE